MLELFRNLLWSRLASEEILGDDPARSGNMIDFRVDPFSGTDWSNGFAGYVLDNDTLWYSERHLAREPR